MSRGEDFRRLTSLRSVSSKVASFARASTITHDADRVHHMFCETRRSILIAIGDRKPFALEASVVEMTAEGDLYLAHVAWSSERVLEDWPGPMRLEIVNGDFGRPSGPSGLAAYCMWSNVSRSGAKGVAVIRDISCLSGDIEFMAQNKLDPDNDETDWHTANTVPNMFVPGRLRANGAAISAPIFDPPGPIQSERLCVGALNITHREVGHFCTPDNYIWAQECAAMLGQLYWFCRERLTELDEFSDWKTVDHALTNGSTGRTSGFIKTKGRSPSPGKASEFDHKRIRGRLAKYLNGSNRVAVAAEIGCSVRTLHDVLTGKRCTVETAEMIVAFLVGKSESCSLADFVIKSTG